MSNNIKRSRETTDDRFKQRNCWTIEHTHTGLKHTNATSALSFPAHLSLETIVLIELMNRWHRDGEKEKKNRSTTPTDWIGEQIERSVLLPDSNEAKKREREKTQLELVIPVR